MNIDFTKVEGNSKVDVSVDNDMTINIKDLYLLNIQKLLKTVERLKNPNQFFGNNYLNEESEKTRI